MYVCLCAGVTDTAIKESILDGCNDLAKLQDSLNVCNDCKCCYATIMDILKEYTNESNSGRTGHLL